MEKFIVLFIVTYIIFVLFWYFLKHKIEEPEEERLFEYDGFLIRQCVLCEQTQVLFGAIPGDPYFKGEWHLYDCTVINKNCKCHKYLRRN